MDNGRLPLQSRSDWSLLLVYKGGLRSAIKSKWLEALASGKKRVDKS